MQLPLNFDPRGYQAEALRALETGIRLAVWCWARRGGKDFTAFGYAVKKMVEQPMNVVLVFPEKEQGRNAFWDNVENDGFKTIEHIPAALIKAQDNTDMKITLINGSTFQILGTKNPDKLRGANGKLYIFSEFVDIDSAAYDVVVPVVEVNGGQIIVQSTPKIDGISGGTFKMMFDDAKAEMENPETGDVPMEYASLVTAEEYLSPKALERLRLKSIKKNGNDFFFRQEFLCDWGQASQSTYYGQILKRLADPEYLAGNIGHYPYNQDFPVYTAWDLGISDSTAITFFQYYMYNNRPTVRIIDYYETSNIGLESIIKYVMSKPYNMAWHFLPHDGSVRDSDAVQRAEKAREYGLVNSSILTREPKEDGINRVAEGLPFTFIHEPMTIELIRKAYLYKRKYNPLTGDYIGPEHKTESHAADTLRYLWVALEQEFNKETCEHYYSQATDDEYESELVQTTYYQPSY